MRSDFSLFALFTAGLAAVVNGYTTPVGDPSGNPITKPGLNDVVDVGKPYQITWTPTTPGFVTLLLLRGPSTNVKPIAVIAENTPNSGSYSWTPPANLEDEETHYGIQLIVDSTGQYQYSTQFGVSNPGYTGKGPAPLDGSGATPPSGGNSTASVSGSASVTVSRSSSASGSVSVSRSSSAVSSSPVSKNATTLTSTTVATSPSSTPAASSTGQPSRTQASPSATGAAVKGYVAGAGSVLLAVVGAMVAL